MFKPSDFFEFAKELEGYTFRYVDACKRTMISRMYYAVFLSVREIIKDKLQGTAVKSMYDSLYRSPFIHRVVLDITHIANPHTKNLLQDLQSERQDADYRLPITDLAERLNGASRITKELFNKIPSLMSEIDQRLSQIQDKVEEWQAKESRRLSG